MQSVSDDLCRAKRVDAAATGLSSQLSACVLYWLALIEQAEDRLFRLLGDRQRDRAQLAWRVRRKQVADLRLRSGVHPGPMHPTARVLVSWWVDSLANRQATRNYCTEFLRGLNATVSGPSRWR